LQILDDKIEKARTTSIILNNAFGRPDRFVLKNFVMCVSTLATG